MTMLNKALLKFVDDYTGEFSSQFDKFLFGFSFGTVKHQKLFSKQIFFRFMKYYDFLIIFRL